MNDNETQPAAILVPDFGQQVVSRPGGVSEMFFWLTVAIAFVVWRWT